MCMVSSLWQGPLKLIADFGGEVFGKISFLNCMTGGVLVLVLGGVGGVWLVARETESVAESSKPVLYLLSFCESSFLKFLLESFL